MVLYNHNIFTLSTMWSCSFFPWHQDCPLNSFATYLFFFSLGPFDLCIWLWHFTLGTTSSLWVCPVNLHSSDRSGQSLRPSNVNINMTHAPVGSPFLSRPWPLSHLNWPWRGQLNRSPESREIESKVVSEQCQSSVKAVMQWGSVKIVSRGLSGQVDLKVK